MSNDTLSKIGINHFFIWNEMAEILYYCLLIKKFKVYMPIRKIMDSNVNYESFQHWVLWLSEMMQSIFFFQNEQIGQNIIYF
jgi:hypothetical protein